MVVKPKKFKNKFAAQTYTNVFIFKEGKVSGFLISLELTLDRFQIRNADRPNAMQNKKNLNFWQKVNYFAGASFSQWLLSISFFISLGSTEYHQVGMPISVGKKEKICCRVINRTPEKLKSIKIIMPTYAFKAENLRFQLK